MRFILFISFILSFGNAGLSGQSTYVPPKIPAKAIKALDDAILVAAAGNTDASVRSIGELIEKYPTWTLPLQKLSEIYYKAGRKNESIAMLESTIAIDSASQIQQLYALGRLYAENDHPERAIKMYETVIRRGETQPELVTKAKKDIVELVKKKALWNNNVKITFTPFPADINTPNEESMGRWTLDGKEFIFTRFLNDQEDIFIAKYDDKEVVDVKDFPFNTERNEGAQTISPDGKALIFTSCERPDGLGGCDLYTSSYKNGSWSRPVNMGSPINTPSYESQPCFGLDGTTIYFSSNRTGGFGGRDIWLVRLQPNGRWSSPVNAGKTINTAANEECPFIHFDGRTLYFMRDGKDGLGGFDLYISRMGFDGKWHDPENMGAPINSGSDEGAFSLHPDGKHAVITRMTANQRNDLFEFLLPDEFLSPPVQALEVRVTDEKTKTPLRARIDVFETEGHDTIRTSQWSDNAGMITMTLERNKAYGLITSAENYVMNSTNLEPDTNSIRKLEITMTPITMAINKTIVLSNIFFATGSSTLLSSSEPELNKLERTLNANPGMHIEIHGHTDDVGTDEDNQVLSEARAKSVYQYLIDKGIDSSRLAFKGFGETQPVAGNDTEAGRKQNRRTEFLIVKI